MNVQNARPRILSRILSDGQQGKGIPPTMPLVVENDDCVVSSRYQLLILESMMTLLVGYQLYTSEPHALQTAALFSVILLTGLLLAVHKDLLQQDMIVWLTTLNTLALLSSSSGHASEPATALGLVIIISMVSYSRSRAHLMVLGAFICALYAGGLHYLGLLDVAHLLVIPVSGALLITYGCRGARAQTSGRPSTFMNQPSHAEGHIDMLTGLPNRHEFMDRVERIIRYTRMNSNFHYAIVFLDLDNFKPINDRLGHKAGDIVLQRIAQRLKSRLKTGDVAARYGGDEFVLLINDVRSQDDVIRVVERILTAVQEPIDVGSPVQVGASFGITLSTSVHASAEDLIKDADAAMYRAKAQGKNRYEISDHAYDTAPGEYKSRLRRLLHSWVD